MNKKAHEIEEQKLKEAELQASSETEYASELVEIDPSLAGHLAELTGQNPQEDLPVHQKSHAKNPATDEELLQDRLKLRENFLEKAPAEHVMRREVFVKLESQKIVLEKEFRKLKRTRLYHKMSEVLAALRKVVHTMKELRHMTYELLEDLWLNLVHKFDYVIS